jgi:SAM-dependent methyltransferase
MTATLYDQFARIYDLQHASFQDDVPLYLNLAREAAQARSGPISILEIGCGSGRVLAPLVAAGYTVTGVDQSRQMLEIAQARLGELGPAARERCALIEADARTMQLGRKFDLAYIALNTFLHNLTREDQLATLRTAREHLQPDARFVIDLPPNDELAFQPDDGQFQLEAMLIDPRADSEIHKYVASRVFWATQEQELSFRIEERGRGTGAVHEQLVSFRLRHVFRHEMDLLLRLSGFGPADWHGDYDRGPYLDDSTRMIAIARAPTQSSLI